MAGESLGKLVARATKSLAVWAKAGFPVVDEATLAKRLAACEGCPLLVQNPNRPALSEDSASLAPQESAGVRAIYRVVGEPVCGACGCLVTAKARMASERCMEGRWE